LNAPIKISTTESNARVECVFRTRNYYSLPPFFTFIHSRFRENRECQKSKSKKLTEIMEENDFQIDSLAALENLVQEVGKDQNHPWHKIEEVFEDLIDSY